MIEVIDVVIGDLKWFYWWLLFDDVYDYVGGNFWNNRNIVIYDCFIINISDDSFVFGLDVDMGEFVWENKIFDY